MILRPEDLLPPDPSGQDAGKESGFPRYARIQRTLLKYGPGKVPGRDLPDEVLEAVEWREIRTNRVLTREEVVKKEAELIAKGIHPDQVLKPETE